MLKFIIGFLFLPLLSTAQTAGTEPSEINNPGGYIIQGTFTGFEEGATVSLLNANNGRPEATTQLQNGKFNFVGKLSNPDFRLITVNNQPKYITLFLDNSKVEISADIQAFEQATVTGSASHDQFLKFNQTISPYEGIINGSIEVKDFSQFDEASKQLEAFISNHTSSYITPLAIYRLYQFTANEEQLEKLFNSLDKEVKLSPIGSHLDRLIVENKSVPLGKPLEDFSQADTLGNKIYLSSYKGKYVLVDFWASWCRPCRDENPNLVNMYNQYKDKNFTVFGVSLDNKKENWIKAIHQDRLTWNHVSDLKGWGNEVAVKFGINSIPQNYLLDPQGNIIAKNLRGVALQYRLHELLK